MDDYKRENRIREALRIRNMKQVELCEKSGVNKSALNNWLAQKWQPKQEPLYKMAKALNVSEMWLAGYDVPMERKTDVITKKDDITLLIETVSNSGNSAKMTHLFNYIMALKPEQLETIESLVNQLHTLNEKD